MWAHLLLAKGGMLYLIISKGGLKTQPNTIMPLVQLCRVTFMRQPCRMMKIYCLRHKFYPPDLCPDDEKLIPAGFLSPINPPPHTGVEMCKALVFCERSCHSLCMCSAYSVSPITNPWSQAAFLS